MLIITFMAASPATQNRKAKEEQTENQKKTKGELSQKNKRNRALIRERNMV